MKVVGRMSCSRRKDINTKRLEAEAVVLVARRYHGEGLTFTAPHGGCCEDGEGVKVRHRVVSGVSSSGESELRRVEEIEARDEKSVHLGGDGGAARLDDDAVR